MSLFRMFHKKKEPEPVIVLNEVELMVNNSANPLKQLAVEENMFFGSTYGGRKYCQCRIEVPKGGITYILECLQKGNLYNYALGAVWGDEGESCKETTPLIYISFFRNHLNTSYHDKRWVMENLTKFNYGADKRVEALIVEGLETMYGEYDRLVRNKERLVQERYEIEQAEEDDRLVVAGQLLDKMVAHIGTKVI